MPKNDSLPTIPLKNLNCLHCKLFTTECKDTKYFNPATGKPCQPEDYYCLKIGKNYIAKP